MAEILRQNKKAARGDFDLFTTCFCAVGGGKRDRTADLLHAMQALSQLSYTPDLIFTLLLQLHLRKEAPY